LRGGYRRMRPQVTGLRTASVVFAIMAIA
jgi:hypothetical protein